MHPELMEEILEERLMQSAFYLLFKPKDNNKNLKYYAQDVTRDHKLTQYMTKDEVLKIMQDVK